ncbi:MAG: cytochrome b N-terminal domain-containing protein [Cyclonatronaceae bacterium]
MSGNSSKNRGSDRTGSDPKKNPSGSLRDEPGTRGGKKGSRQDTSPGKFDWKAFKSNVIKATEPSPVSALRGQKWLDRFDRLFRRLDGFTLRYVREEYHPYVQAGAAANFMFVVAVITGFALLIWYSPSVHMAYDSVKAMSGRPYTAELMRSLHRYSSDAFMLLVVFHAFKVFFAGRFTGSRWLAWVTGIVGVAIIWFDGWLGYWLVWDERGAMVAVATARMLDMLPFFADPLEASFLTDQSFSSVLFLIVFFLHMLIPIGFGVAIWLHVSRLNKPGFMTNLNFSLILLGSLVVVSLLFPADLADRADLMKAPASLEVDYYYLLPLILTERVHGGILWLIVMVTTVILLGIPWLLYRKKAENKPVVDEIRCNGCTQCFHDCPYNAIAMLPRQTGDPQKSELTARIDPSVCVACGICVGSCDPVAVEYPDLSPWEIRRRLDRWLDDESTGVEGHYVAFVCGNSAGSLLTIEPETGICEQMPGYKVCTLPCAGWVHPTLIERALKKNAAGVLIAGCESDPDFRLGADWLGHRIEGARHPEYRKDRFEEGRLLFLKLDKPEYRTFLAEAKRFQQSGSIDRPVDRQVPLWQQITAGVIMLVLLAVLTVWPSSAALTFPDPEPELVISFKMKGAPVFEDDDGQGRLSHMQRPEGTQRVASRSDVHMRVLANGEMIFSQRYRPRGIFRRGYSSGMVHLPLKPGSHELQVSFGTGDQENVDWIHTDHVAKTIDPDGRIVLQFSETGGFRWYDRYE